MSSTLRTGDQAQTAQELETEWKTDARWNGIQRDYTADDVIALRGSVREQRTLAKRGAENLWALIHGTEDGGSEWVPALGALTGNQAVQQIRAGLKAIYLSGWQVAADANLSGQTYPDQSLYPANSVPAVVRRINNALLRADQIEHAEGLDSGIDWLAPIVADAYAGLGGPLNAYELMSSMIEAGAAGVHWEDQLASEKKCGHMGGKVLIPTGQHIRTLNAARLASDVAGVSTLIVARTDSLAADHITSDHYWRAQQLAEAIGQRPGAERQFQPLLGPPQVGAYDDPCAAVTQRNDGRQRCANAPVVDDRAVLHRSVEINAQQDALSGHLDVVDGGHVCARLDAHKRPPIYSIRSTTRQE